MKLFIDDANLEAIKEINEYYPVDGVTTNPSILAKAKRDPRETLKAIREIIGEEKITGGVLLNQKMTPQMLSTEENKQKLEMLLRAFFNRLHGYHVQYNIVSRETLLDAQAHPEKHKDLIVRVAGYSAFFNVLSRKTQDDIIGRTEQSL